MTDSGRLQSITMGEAKVRWMEDVLAHPDKYSEDYGKLAGDSAYKAWPLEPSPWFSGSIQFAVFAPLIEKWAVEHGMKVVKI